MVERAQNTSYPTNPSSLEVSREHAHNAVLANAWRSGWLPDCCFQCWQFAPKWLWSTQLFFLLILVCAVYAPSKFDKNFDSVVFLDVQVKSLKLNMIINKPLRFYTFVPLSVTLLQFQGHRRVVEKGESKILPS